MKCIGLTDFLFSCFSVFLFSKQVVKHLAIVIKPCFAVLKKKKSVFKIATKQTPFRKRKLPKMEKVTFDFVYFILKVSYEE